MGPVRTSRSTVFIVVGLIFTAIFVGLAFNHGGESWEFSNHPTVDDTTPDVAKPETEKPVEPKPESSTSEGSSDLYNFFLKEVQKPIVKPDTEKYQPYGAFDWKLKGDKNWKENLGKDLCIIDIDNRPFDEPGQAFGHPAMSWDRSNEVHGLSLGAINHWLYAKIHGYSYYFVTFDTPEDRRASWEKPSIIKKILKKHKTCVYVDSDAIFFHLDLPFEWLMNYWEINPKKHSLSLSFDPDFPHNKDEFGKLYLNTGFIVAQNQPKTFEILEDWDDCTNKDGKHPDCHEFSFNEFGRPTDQGGFGTYIRYDYEDNIKELPCAEANGFPEDPSECKGQFIRHMWSGKDTLIKIVTGHQFPGKFLEILHEKFMGEKPDFYKSKAELMKWD